MKKKVASKGPRKNITTWTYMLWIILGGCLSLSLIFFGAIILIVSLFGIPMAQQAFRLAYYEMSGMDNYFEPDFKAAKAKNIIWAIIIGWLLYLIHKFFAGLFYITYVGRPLARIWNSTAKLVLMPFGIEITY